MSDNPLYHHPGILVLRRALQRELRLQILASVILLIFGLFLIWCFFSKSWIITIIGLVTTVLGIRLVLKTAKNWEVDHHPIMQTLYYQPRQIVWVYSLHTQRMPFGFEFSNSGTLYVKMIDGDEFSVSLPAKKLKLVSKTLSRVLPHASFGYSKVRAQWFLESPEKLLNQKKGE